MKVCVQTQIAIRRVQRHPVTKRVVRRVVQGTAMGVVPGTLNDVVFHHSSLDLNEIVHATQDSLTVSVLTAIALCLKSAVV